MAQCVARSTAAKPQAGAAPGHTQDAQKAPHHFALSASRARKRLCSVELVHRCHPLLATLSVCRSILHAQQGECPLTPQLCSTPSGCVRCPYRAAGKPALALRASRRGACRAGGSLGRGRGGRCGHKRRSPVSRHHVTSALAGHHSPSRQRQPLQVRLAVSCHRFRAAAFGALPAAQVMRGVLAARFGCSLSHCRHVRPAVTA